MSKLRLQFDVSREEMEQYEELVVECATGTKKGLEANMRALWVWAVEESRKGRKIGSFASDKTNVEAVVMPPLEQIRRRATPKGPDG